MLRRREARAHSFSDEPPCSDYTASDHLKARQAKEMQYYTNEGTWWLRRHQRSVITGTLSFSVSGLDLLVTGWFLTAGVQQRKSEQNYGPTDWEKLPIIHGVTTRDRRPVTLLQVEGAPHVGPSGVKIENNYIAGIALGGIHVARDSFTEMRPRGATPSGCGPTGSSTPEPATPCWESTTMNTAAGHALYACSLLTAPAPPPPSGSPH